MHYYKLVVIIEKHAYGNSAFSMFSEDSIKNNHFNGNTIMSKTFDAFEYIVCILHTDET